MTLVMQKLATTTTTTTTSSPFASSKKHALKTLWSFLVSEQQLFEYVRASCFRYFARLRFTMLCVVVCLLFKSGTMQIILLSHAQLAICTLSALSLALMCCTVFQRLRPSPCYLVDFCCTEGETSSMVTVDNFSFFLRTWKSVKEKNLFFQFKVFLRSGIGEEAYAPPQLLDKGEQVNMQDARLETQGLIVKAVGRLLAKLEVAPKEIDILIVNSSLFNPAPSLTAFVVNHFKLRSNVRSFSLAGMGCSAGLISIDLAKDLLKVHRDSYALVVSTENITQNMYFGNDRSMMVSNCLFRIGCSAVLLSNKAGERGRAKFELMHCVRTHIGADQKAYECVHHMEDEQGKLGVSLHMNLMEVAGVALRANITRLAPLILPMSELVKVGLSMLRRRLIKRAGAYKVYEPDFKKAVGLFCIHPGGRAVVESIGKGLKLSEQDIEPGKMALYRFGNTSSSGIWYALAYCEAKGRLKKGVKVWQIGLGSGFKCNSAVWKTLRDIQPWDGFGTNPWLPCIRRYPVTTALTPEYQQAEIAKLLTLLQTPADELLAPADTPAAPQPKPKPCP